MKSMRSAFLFLPVSAMLLCALGGCSGDGKATVSGKVTYQDKPVTSGTVVFVPEDKAKMGDRAPIKPDGTYSTSNLPLGKMKVGVEPGQKGAPAQMPKGAKFGKDKQPGQYAPEAAASPAGAYVDIPDKYRNPDTSGLTVDVNSSSKTYDIPLGK
jgi:hypothetical protein